MQPRIVRGRCWFAPNLHRFQVQPEARQAARTTATVRDAVFLILIVWLSAVLYVGGVGFKSEDWGVYPSIAASPDRSPIALFGVLYQGDVRMRPVQAIALAILYSL